jgi:mRNA interferase HicA
MKRKELLKYLRNNGCEFLREGGRHSWWHNPTLNKKSAIPRHNEIRDILAKKICKDLSIPPVK